MGGDHRAVVLAEYHHPRPGGLTAVQILDVAPMQVWVSRPFSNGHTRRVLVLDVDRNQDRVRLSPIGAGRESRPLISSFIRDYRLQSVARDRTQVPALSVLRRPGRGLVDRHGQRSRDELQQHGLRRRVA